MNGKSYQKTTLNLSLTNYQTKALEILLLLLVGVLIATLRAHLRIPMNIPGRHGIEVMAILISARMISQQSFASSITMLATSAMMFLPFMGFKDPTAPFMYMGVGLLLDYFWNKFSLNSKNMFMLALFGGLVYMLIPILRIGFHFSSIYVITSFVKHGIILPIFTHFIFGFVGTLLGLGIIKSIKRK
ncbi:MAG TPA: hypothetical protein DDX39_00055 [Bacteroidales bacterium]|nr:MAG: hypothetical protein A2W98_05230 [Bacteroidetes bacterium GWF2_33_38]OFY75378.1 MAG: hypothetical protein A2265_06485 [Bacteroidetes bacterium RIFOXYA12_FULL_33_9]OFY92175.1 MAG: hypothetical protein A2236_11930 [Bacteroidetes bacterium RIFOXYA2_FULL_33_7]HBF87002.1 hypothetical protein [Bacteroidales bacterium]